MQSRSLQFVKYTVNTIAIRIIVFAILVAATIITARVLGPSGRGELAVLTLTATVAFVVGELGLGRAIVYYIGGGKLKVRETASSSLFCQIFIGLAISGILLLLTGFWRETIYAGIPRHYLWMVIAALPLLLITSSQLSVVQGLYKIPLFNLLNMLQPATFLLLLLLLTVAGGWHLEGAVIAWVAGYLIAFLGTILAVLREKGIGLSGVNLSAIKSLFSFGVKSYGGNFLKYLQYRFDVLIVAYLLSPAAAGYYIVATTVAEAIWQIPNAVQVVLFPRIASLDESDARRWTPVVCRQTILLTGIACCVLFASASVLIPFIFGQEYSPSISPFVILLPGVFMLAIWKILHVDLIGQGFPLIYSFTAAISVVTMVVLDLIFIPRWGINGAALACTISYSVSTVVIIYFYLRITKNHLVSLLLPQLSDFARYTDLLKSFVAKLPSSSGKR